MKWEYCWAYGDLNELGAEGWEAVGICTYGRDEDCAVLMKRPIAEPLAIQVAVPYGIYLGAMDPPCWLRTPDGRIAHSTSRIVMEAEAAELDKSWGATVRLLNP